MYQLSWKMIFIWTAFILEKIETVTSNLQKVAGRQLFVNQQKRKILNMIKHLLRWNFHKLVVWGTSISWKPVGWNDQTSYKIPMLYLQLTGQRNVSLSDCCLSDLLSQLFCWALIYGSVTCFTEGHRIEVLRLVILIWQVSFLSHRLFPFCLPMQASESDTDLFANSPPRSKYTLSCYISSIKLDLIGGLS